MKKLLFWGSIVLTSVILFSCSKDEDSKDISRQEAEQVLSNVNTEVSQSMEQMMSCSAMGAIQSFAVYAEYFGAQTKSSILNSITPKSFYGEKDVLVRAIKVPAIDFEQMVGTWTWNRVEQSWSQKKDVTDKIIFLFPANSESNTNDATLSLSNYSEVSNNDNVLITSLDASLTLENSTSPIFTASYRLTATDTGTPEQLTVNISMAPFSLVIKASIQQGTESITATFSHELKNSDVLIMSSNLEINMVALDLENDQYPNTAKGFLQIGSLKVTLDLGIKSFVDGVNNATGSEIEASANSNLKMALYTYPQNDKIGTIKWVYNTAYNPENNNDPIIPHIVFNDGTSAPMEQFLLFLTEFDSLK